jgi:short-subunit dehydrogenase
MAVALVTGASGGIGLAIARELASRKHGVMLVARSGDTLKKNCEEIRREFGVTADYLALDLATPGAPAAVNDWVVKSGHEVDILVNNAGYGFLGALPDLPEKEFQGMIQLNMVTLASLCRLFAPGLKKQPKAFILNVASTAAYQAIPTLSLYAATKAFVLLLSRGLRWELKGTSVSVSCLCPGPTSTGFIERAQLKFMEAKAEKFSMTPEKVAGMAVNAMFAGKAEIIPGFTNWLSSKLAEIVPKGIPERIALNLYKTK